MNLSCQTAQLQFRFDVWEEMHYLQNFAYLRRYVFDDDVVSSPQFFRSFLLSSLKSAYARDAVASYNHPQSIAFPLLLADANIWALCIKHHDAGNRYALTRYIECADRPRFDKVALKRKPLLLEYAYFPKPNWWMALGECACREDWDGPHPRGRKWLLYTYLLRTFEIQARARRLVWSRSGKCAAFRTGLYSRKGGKPIFGTFGLVRTRAYFRGWHKAGSMEMEKFETLPQFA